MKLPKCCGKSAFSDLTHGQGEVRNFYCGNCGSHFYKGKFYSREEWEKWIEQGVQADGC